MKKVLLLLLGFMSYASVSANDFETPTEKTTINNWYDDAVTFVERGVQFHIFLNGDFEFNSPNRKYYDYNGERYSQDNIRIDRDYKGRIKRVGRNYIYYDYKGNVSRIGNVRMYYSRNLLRRVGDLKITYNSWGDPYFYGNVHRTYYDSDVSFSLNIGSIFNYNDRFFYNNSFKNTYRKYREDKYYYYYKARPNTKYDKRNKIIKRRKSGVTTRKNNDYTKRKTTPNRKTTVKRNTSVKRNSTPKRVTTTRKNIKRGTPKTSVKKEIKRGKTNTPNKKRRG